MDGRNQQSTSRGGITAQSNKKTNVPSTLVPNDQNLSKGPEQKRMTQLGSTATAMGVARETLDKQGLLKNWDNMTSKSIEYVLKLIDDKYGTKIPMELRKSLAAISICIQGMQGKEGPDSKSMIEEISKAISEKVENKLNPRIEKVEAAAEKMQKIAEDTSRNMEEVAKSSNKINNTVSTYKDVILTPPPLQNEVAKGPQQRGYVDPRITRDTERKSRQILIDIYNKEFMNKSMDALKDKFSEAIGRAPTPRPKDIEIQEVHKFKNGSVMLQFRLKEMVDWMKQPEIETAVMVQIDVTATIKERTYHIIAPRVPVTFSPNEESSLRELEELNYIKENAIIKAKWLKLISKRTPGQQFALVLLTIKTPEEANKLIRDGMYVRGVKTYPKKSKIEPRQCMKCRKWGHYVLDCLEAYDTCGNCGGNHTTRDCPNPQDKFCVSCKANDHASWDRRCPEFLRRIKRLDQNLPENVLKYFPTDESWTVSMSQIRVKYKQNVPTKIAIASLPPPATRGNRVQTTRNITKANTRKPTGQKEEGQATLDEYVAKEIPKLTKQKAAKKPIKCTTLGPGHNRYTVSRWKWSKLN